MMKKALIAVALAMTLMAAPAMAKEGFYLGVNVLFNEVSGDVNSPEWMDSGNGLGLRGGFGLNRYLAIEAGLWKTKHDMKYSAESVDLKAGTLDLKLNLPLSGSQIEPYILVGVGSYELEQSAATEDGTGMRFGIGMDIYLFPELSFNVGLTRNNVTFEHNNVDVDGKVQTLDFGFSYHFI
ncbi:MAG: outer membrane beta-barrel protein [Nitrospirota bacterium]